MPGGIESLEKKGEPRPWEIRATGVTSRTIDVRRGGFGGVHSWRAWEVTSSRSRFGFAQTPSRAELSLGTLAAMGCSAVV